MVKENEPISLGVLEPFFVLFCCLSFPFNSIHNQISNILKIRREKRNDLCKAEQYRKLEKICYASMRTLSFSNLIWNYFLFRWLAEIFFWFFQEETNIHRDWSVFMQHRTHRYQIKNFIINEWRIFQTVTFLLRICCFPLFFLSN